MKYSAYTHDDIVRELIDLKKHLGRFPTTSDIRCEHPTLLNAIYKNGYNYNAIKKSLGEQESKMGNKHWHDFARLAEALKPLIKHGVFPTEATIKQTISGIMGGVNHFGGLIKVAERMGYPISRFYQASDGHNVRSSYEYFVDEFLYSRNIPHEVDGRISPNYNYRYDFKVQDHFIEVWGYMGRQRYLDKRKIKEALYRDLGLHLVSIEMATFQKIPTEIEAILESIFSQLGCPTQKTNDFSMENAMRIVGFWSDSRIIQEIHNLVQDNQFPTQKQLGMVRGLASAVGRHGGMSHFRKIMGFPPRYTGRKKHASGAANSSGSGTPTQPW